MPVVGVYRGFATGHQHSMRLYGAFVLDCLRRALPGWTLLEQYDRPFLYRDGPTGLVYKVDRHWPLRRRFDGQELDLLVITDQSDAHLALSIKAKRKLLVCHDVLPRMLQLGLVEGPSPGLMGRKLIGWNAKALAAADQIVCVSEATRRDLVEHYDVKPERVAVIHNPDLTAFDDFAGERPAIRDEIVRLVAEAQPFILCIGGTFYKNIELAAPVLAQLQQRHGIDAHCIVVGTPTLSATSDRLSFVQGLSSAELGLLYGKAQLLLFPSLYEGFGLPVIEAQRHGLPVICSNRASLPEVAGEGAIVIEPHDACAAADAAAAIFTNRALRERLVSAGRDNVRRFTLETSVEKYARIIETLVSDRHCVSEGTPGAALRA